jgi:hypothetical protein
MFERPVVAFCGPFDKLQGVAEGETLMGFLLLLDVSGQSAVVGGRVYCFAEVGA